MLTIIIITGILLAIVTYFMTQNANMEEEALSSTQYWQDNTIPENEDESQLERVNRLMKEHEDYYGL